MYNPVPRRRDLYVRLPFKMSNKVKIYTSEGRPLQVQFVALAQSLQNIPGRPKDSTNIMEAILKVEKVPALGQ